MHDSSLEWTSGSQDALDAPEKLFGSAAHAEGVDVATSVPTCGPSVAIPHDGNPTVAVLIAALPGVEQLYQERNQRRLRRIVTTAVLLGGPAFAGAVAVSASVGSPTPMVMVPMLLALPLSGFLLAVGYYGRFRENGAPGFYCPSCMELVVATLSCPHCKTRLGTFNGAMQPQGPSLLSTQCSFCRGTVSGPEEAILRKLNRRCEECLDTRGRSSHVLYARIVGVAESREFDRLCRLSGLEPCQTMHGWMAIQSAVEEPLLMLDLERLELGPEHHASNHPALGIEALWMGAEADPLHVAQSLDRLRRIMGGKAKRLREVPVLMEGMELSAVLEPRFRTELGPVCGGVSLPTLGRS